MSHRNGGMKLKCDRGTLRICQRGECSSDSCQWWHFNWHQVPESATCAGVHFVIHDTSVCVCVRERLYMKVRWIHKNTLMYTHCLWADSVLIMIWIWRSSSRRLGDTGTRWSDWAGVLVWVSAFCARTAGGTSKRPSTYLEFHLQPRVHLSSKSLKCKFIWSSTSHWEEDPIRMHVWVTFAQTNAGYCFDRVFRTNANVCCVL